MRQLTGRELRLKLVIDTELIGLPLLMLSAARYPLRFWLQAGRFETSGGDGGNA